MRERERHVVERVIRRAENLDLGRGFYAWKYKVSEAGRYEAIYRKVRGRWTRRAAAAAVAKWCDVVAQTKRQRLAVKRSLLRMRNRVKAGSFNTWLLLVEEARHARRVCSRRAP